MTDDASTTRMVRELLQRFFPCGDEVGEGVGRAPSDPGGKS